MPLNRDDRAVPTLPVTEPERARERPARAMQPLHTYMPPAGSSGLQAYGQDWKPSDEWQRHRKLHKHFLLAGKETGGRTGLHQYVTLRDEYIRHGYGPNPLARLEERLVSFEWYGDDLTVDKDLKPLLIEAARLFGENRKSSTKPYKNLSGSFFPRLQAGSTAISNHAFGRAIDLDAEANGLIANKGIIQVVMAATGRNVGTRMPMLELSEASGLFSQIATPDWLDARESEGGKLGATIRKHRKALEGLAKHGFSNLDPLFIEAMASQGLRWGGEYGDRKDAMHFELLPDRSQRRKAR